MATTFSSVLEGVRARFPALRAAGDREIFFDNAAGAQVPDEVVDAMRDHLVARNVQRGGRYPRSREVDAAIEGAREILAAFLNAPFADEVVFGLNSTSLIRMVAESLRPALRTGDRIVVTDLDHEANVGPWLRLESSGVTPLVWKVRGPGATLEMDDLRVLLGSAGGPVRLVAMPLASNATGGIVDVAAAARLAREAGAWTFVDAVHFAPHGPIDVRVLGADFLAFSGYKIFGPHVGFLWGRREALRALTPAREFFIQGGAPYAFEGGTQVYEGIAGMAGAMRYLSSLGTSASGANELDPASTRRGASESDLSFTRSLDRRPALVRAMSLIREYESDLARTMLRTLREIPELRILGESDPERASKRIPTFSFRIDGLTPAAIVERLAAEGIHARDGHMYAPRLIEAVGIDPMTGVCRVSLCHYNTPAEIDRFAETIRAVTDHGAHGPDRSSGGPPQARR
ncbi:MAG TPA: cysteine desulfurase-like protein [Candidatus Eisenbacteria bacterium]|nr:cysteine desulfurase-like protein [Candidatus Eisenbacteria bacterium]